MGALINILKYETFYLYISISILLLVIIVLFVFIIKHKVFKKDSVIKKRNAKVLFFLVFVFAVFSSLTTYVYYNFESIKLNLVNKALDIKEVNILNYDKNKNLISINIELVGNLFIDDVHCLINNEEEVSYDDEEWILSKKGSCKFEEVESFKYIHLKSSSEVKKFNVSDFINELFEIEIKKEEIYLILGESYDLEFSVHTIGKIEEVLWKSENENIVKVENGKLSAISAGTTKVVLTDEKIKDEISVTVTDLITNIHIDNSRPFINCGKYTEDEANLLDKLLFYKVEEAGNQTRAGVVAAARFLSMQFPYKIPYFLENGRLTQPKRYGDGEGRYYHKGLYLSTSKFSTIIKARSGPAIWGCPILEYDSDTYRPNGLDCSGFVSWAILNGGFDIGDQGANGWTYSDNDLTNHGDRQYITWDLLNSRVVKAGDLASIPGHIAIVVGIDYDNQVIYIAEELRYSQGLVVLSLSFSELVTHNDFTHLVLMDKYYINDGNYSDMW